VSARILSELATFWEARIRSFTRLGKSLATGNRLAPLSKAYVEKRRSYQGARGELFKPNKSNLTFTGQLLESLRGTANEIKQTVTVRATGTRDDGLTNDKLAEYVAKQGRPFLGLDEKGRARMSQIILRDLRRKLKARKKLAK
jgi:hypothetical protein